MLLSRKPLSYCTAETAEFRESRKCGFQRCGACAKPCRCWGSHSLTYFKFRILKRPLAELGDFKALNALGLLAEQLERADIAGEARAKAIDVASGGAQQEIDQLSSCLIELVNAEANYHARWRMMLGQIGGDAEE